MKSFLYIVILAIFWSWLFSYAESKELPKEMSMATETGEVVLTLIDIEDYNLTRL